MTAEMCYNLVEVGVLNLEATDFKCAKEPNRRLRFSALVRSSRAVAAPPFFDLVVPSDLGFSSAVCVLVSAYKFSSVERSRGNTHLHQDAVTSSWQKRKK